MCWACWHAEDVTWSKVLQASYSSQKYVFQNEDALHHISDPYNLSSCVTSPPIIPLCFPPPSYPPLFFCHHNTLSSSSTYNLKWHTQPRFVSIPFTRTKVALGYQNYSIYVYVFNLLCIYAAILTLGGMVEQVNIFTCMDLQFLPFLGKNYLWVHWYA